MRFAYEFSCFSAPMRFPCELHAFYLRDFLMILPLSFLIRVLPPSFFAR
jgi:hypothetical protein